MILGKKAIRSTYEKDVRRRTTGFSKGYEKHDKPERRINADLIARYYAKAIGLNKKFHSKSKMKE